MATIESNVLTGETTQTAEETRLAQRVAELGEWFHNLNLNGVQTAPNHFLGDFPGVKWRALAPAFPEDMTGATVLDLGCNGGFYSIELKKRGASRVLGVDVDDRYLNQAKFAAEVLGLEIEFEKRSVYDVDKISGQFDYVLFMGVFYHLRYPLYALDKVIKKVAGKLIFQTMIRGSLASPLLQDDYHFWNKKVFDDPDFPCMYFIEKNYANDPTNWWIPNHGAMEGMLRSSGLEIVGHPEPEIWVCVPAHVQRDGQYILDHELAGTL
ncbi:MAG TPA: TIGR04290 family methyltransferase [Candidatus Angelobacter sp.]|jgi:tRNA (mo5U34)-methyltransferase|nr:TIGR04290 family methyltransferase [Candidatus Angelobacter sp.]